jgi:hypothetical protein
MSEIARDIAMLDFEPAGFAAALLDPALPSPACIAVHGGATREDRFAIYRNNVVQGLIAALETRFPMVQRVVGEAFFAGAARLYIGQNPPRTPIMAFYGEDFPDFLAQFPPGAELPYLADLARLEAARTRAYHAEDAAPLPPEAFANLAPGDLLDLRLVLHPSLFILASPYPVATIFAMNSGALPLAAIEDWRGEDVLVARPRMSVEVRALPPGGAAFLTKLAQAATLGEAAGATLAGEPQFDLTDALASLIRFGLAIEIRATASPLQ